jgi:serine protease inhibitor
VLVSLPRFELEWEGVLNQSLTDLGMEPCLQPGREPTSRPCSRVSGLFISEVRQNTFVRVDEEGTESRPPSRSVVGGVTSLPPEVRADRPFLFALRERLSGTILFIGVITDPPAI